MGIFVFDAMCVSSYDDELLIRRILLEAHHSSKRRYTPYLGMPLCFSSIRPHICLIGWVTYVLAMMKLLLINGSYQLRV